MLFNLPPDDTLYAAMAARDAAWDGHAFVGVTSTGIFCRIPCPARIPKRENCRFFDRASACIEAGFRPCKRCHPLGDDPIVERLMIALKNDPLRRWGEHDLTAMGLELSTVRRAFKRATGQTFLELARQRRVAASLGTLSEGENVVFAQIDAGFESPSAFRNAFARIIGRAPGNFAKDAILRADWIRSPLGPMIAVSDRHALHLLEFPERKALPRELDLLWRDAKGQIGFGRFPATDRIEAELAAYFAGESARFDTPLAPRGTTFQRDVWEQLRHIPAGQTRSYGEIARALGRPSAVRAVAAANGANPIAIVIPCHRVIGADGALTGYGGGIWRKRQLISIERRFREKERIS